VAIITRLRDDGLSIGQLSRRTGVKLETIRYYERIGVLQRPPRTAAGHRVYGADGVRTLMFVHRARQLGFPLAEIRALLALRAVGPACCSGARDLTLRHLARVRAEIADLTRRARLLEQLAERNSAEGRLGCAVMDLLEARIAIPFDEAAAAIQERLARNAGMRPL
jgi:MerR family transcriptional regulator, mercuric resistance operon regulatory protein